MASVIAPRLFIVAYLLTLAHHFVLGEKQYTAYNYGFDVHRRVRRQFAQPSTMIVMGNAATQAGDVQVRREIRELEQDREVWTLYLLGMSMMQFTDQSSPTSWYGITGIHGMPHQTWGGVRPTPGNEETGYCTHSSILFPTWHRPYLALYEQVLSNVIRMIATWWPEDQKQPYVDAAKRFRIPYWDWATYPPSGGSVLPMSVGGSPFVDIDGPSGVQRISNPLFSYTFRPLNTTAFRQAPWNTWSETLRSPTNWGPGAQSNNSMVAMTIDQNQRSLSQRLYILFSNYGNYSRFSNNAWIPFVNNASYDSIESLHDTIHNLAGGGGIGQLNIRGGHMSFIPYSAFDPIFFLHHAMVDRIFAMWQTLYPQSWVTPTTAVLNSYTTARGQVQDSRTPLTPFFADANGAFWTSDSVRDFTKFGYTYTELTDLASPRKAQAGVRRAINRLYGASSPANMFLRELRAQGIKGGRGRGGTSRAGQQSSQHSPAGGVASNMEGAVEGDSYREWIVNIRAKKQALDGPYSIYFFFGTPPSNKEDWAQAENHVGTMGVFAADGAGMGGMMEAMKELEVSGTVPLTTGLIKAVQGGELEGLQPEEVVRFLRERLVISVLGPEGREFGVSEVKGLKLSVGSFRVRLPGSEDELPVWGEEEGTFDLV
ncbi:putative tyrosinase [Triangularia verruculosa]|uniref:Tyrosinase n=1 Tax=Triangularia verruculosa TaxID=2587418 RepID=A0AAN6XK38_9PEZI|nr:putative tyrosinase [Triangularia verruculosa]